MVYDLTVSSLTAGTPTQLTEKNDLLIDGTVVLQQNFGILTLTVPRKKRVMNIKIYDSLGKELWSKDIQAPK
jgi:alkaline phosphatase D